MSTNSSNIFGVLRIPAHVSLPASMLQSLQDAALLTATSTEPDGEYFGMQLGAKVAATDIAPDAVIMVPLFTKEDTVVLNYDLMAAGPRLYLMLVGPPQPLMTYAICLAYSNEASEKIVPIGQLVRFPSPLHFVVAKTYVVDRLAELSVIRNGKTPPVDTDSSVKRPCIRPLGFNGEPAELSSDKGMCKFILDLDGRKYPTRNKSDLTQREKDLGFIFRSLDEKRWEFAMSTDYLLQPEEYRSMIIDQGKTRADHRHKAFESCGFLDKIQSLDIVQKTSSLKLLLTGSFLVEGSSPTLSLEDFTDSERISVSTSVCLEQNRPLVAALRNFQHAMLISFSKAFEGCLDAFIVDLEGSRRPLELVAADFLKYSVEFILKKFFRVVRSERASSMSDEVSLKNPVECNLFL